MADQDVPQTAADDRQLQTRDLRTSRQENCRDAHLALG
jgi:hypothetical protein